MQKAESSEDNGDVIIEEKPLEHNDDDVIDEKSLEHNNDVVMEKSFRDDDNINVDSKSSDDDCVIISDEKPCENNSVIEVENIQNDHPEIKQVEHKLKNPPFDVEVFIHNTNCVRVFKSAIEVFLKNLLSNEATYAIHCKTVDENESEEMFCIDKASSSSMLSDHRTPIYNSPFRPLFQSSSDGKNKNKRDDEDFGNEKKKKKTMTPLLQCFNCLGSHHLSACPEERNFYRIRENRKSYLEDKTTPNTSRYYEGKSNTFDESKFRPGMISERLRKAMNLNPEELPFYIYRMRLLGYPPGWLSTAEVETSGISLINTDGKVDGDTSLQMNNKKYDARKFIQYPGFNCPVPDGVIDEWKRYQMPPMQRHQQLSEVWKHDLVFTPTPPKKSKSKHRKDEKEKRDTVSKGSEEKGSNDVINNSSHKESKADDKIVESSVEDKEKKGLSRSVSLGAIVIDTGNPCKELPSAEKFAVGITDHMNYENLADGSGTYEKLRGVLEKVREIKSKNDN